jgi:tRNA(Ile)-lysidine synthase
LPPSSLATTIRDFSEREGLLRPGDRVLVGVSGGADSTALLHILLEITPGMTLGLGVAHVNHLMRGAESDRDEAFVRRLAEREGLPCYVERADVKAAAASSGLSVQQAGRRIRYDFFSRMAAAGGYGTIAVAHTMDDQVETFLLRVVKGTGLRGLAAIPLKRDNIVRPLLMTSRAHIEAYLRRKGISHVEDSSNRGLAYERNYIRHRLVPPMERLNPAVREAVVNLLTDLRAVNDSIEGDVRSFVTRCVRRDDEGIAADTGALAALTEEVRFRVYGALAAELDERVLLQRRQGRLVDGIVFGAAPNAAVHLPMGLRARRSYGHLRFSAGPDPDEVTDLFPVRLGFNDLPPLNCALTLAVAEKEEVQLGGDPATAYLDMDRLESLTVRTFRNGDRFVPLGMKKPVKLKDFFMGQKIDRQARRRIPLLLSGHAIAWVTGRRIDERFKVGPATTRVLRATLSKRES